MRLLVLFLSLMLSAITIRVEAGTPMQACPVPGHEGPRCHMGSCASYDKNGKPNGSICSKDCAEKCCSCPAASCNRHHEQPE